jgi:GNAT superfamily N-acetyltransferase
VLLELVAEYCQADEHVFDEHVVRGGLEPLLIDDTFGAIWMIDPEPDTANGYVVVTWGWSIEIGGLDVVLDEFYVRSSGQGKGSHALGVIEHDCRARGVKRILLETELANERARRLYERHGYHADTSVWMSKELT